MDFPKKRFFLLSVFLAFGAASLVFFLLVPSLPRPPLRPGTPRANSKAPGPPVSPENPGLARNHPQTLGRKPVPLSPSQKDGLQEKAERKKYSRIPRPRALDYFCRDDSGRLPSPEKILALPWFARFKCDPPLYKNKELCGRISRMVMEARAKWVKEQKEYAVNVSRAVDFLQSHGLPLVAPSSFKGRVATGTGPEGRFRIPENWCPEVFEPLDESKRITEELTRNIERAVRDFMFGDPRARQNGKER